MDIGWIEHVHTMSPGWDNPVFRSALAQVTGLREQEAEHQNEFYVDHKNHESLQAEAEALIGGKFDEVLVYSFDSNNGNGLLKRYETDLPGVCRQSI